MLGFDKERRQRRVRVRLHTERKPNARGHPDRIGVLVVIVDDDLEGFRRRPVLVLVEAEDVADLHGRVAARAEVVVQELQEGAESRFE